MNKVWSYLLLLITISSCCVIHEGKYKLRYDKKKVICNCFHVKKNGVFENEIRELSNKNYLDYVYCPILTKKEGVGVYQYWAVKFNVSTANFFMYNGEKIELIKEFDFEIIKAFLKQNNFKENKIEKLKERINKCIEANKYSNGSW